MVEKLIDALLVVTKTGVPLFMRDYVYDNDNDNILFAGALTAIQNLIVETTEEEVKSVELQNSEYLIEQGEYVYVALRSRKTKLFPFLRIIAKEIGKKFEEIFIEDLKRGIIETNKYEKFSVDLDKIFKEYGYSIIERLASSPSTLGITIFNKSYDIILEECMDTPIISQHQKENVAALLGPLMVETAKAVWAPISRQIDLVERFFVYCSAGYVFQFEWTRKIIIASISKPKKPIPHETWAQAKGQDNDAKDKIMLVLGTIVDVFERAINVVQWGSIDYTVVEFMRSPAAVFYPRQRKVLWAENVNIIGFTS